jgi:hypothetical protein
VVSQPDDSHIYHVQIGKWFIACSSVPVVMSSINSFSNACEEVLPKVAYHLDFLLANPDIKILVILASC